MLQIIFGSGRDVSNCHLLSGAATQGRHQLCFQVLLRVVVAVIKWCILRYTQRLATRHNRYFGHRINILLQQTGQRMTAFMVRNDIQIRFTQHQRALGANEYLVQGSIKAVLCHRNQIAACCQQSRFVDEIGNVGANHPRRGTRNRNQVYIFCQRHAARMNLENSQAAIPVGPFHYHTAVEATRTQERFVQAIGSVCSSDDDNGLARIKAIHLNQQLVQSLLALVVAVDAGASLATDGIDLIDEDDAGSRFLGLIEEITHTTRADTDQHFHELRAAHREEWHSRLTGNGACQQGLTSSRRPYQQHTTRNLSTQALELLRRLQKFNHLNKIVFRLIDACHIGKGGARSISWHNFGSGLPKAEDVLLALCGPANDEEDDAKH